MTPLSNCCKTSWRMEFAEGKKITQNICDSCNKPCYLTKQNNITPTMNTPLSSCCKAPVTIREKLGLPTLCNFCGKYCTVNDSAKKVEVSEYQKQYEWKKKHYFGPMVQILLRDPAFWEVILDTVHAHERVDLNLPSTNQTS